MEPGEERGTQGGTRGGNTSRKRRGIVRRGWLAEREKERAGVSLYESGMTSGCLSIKQSTSLLLSLFLILRRFLSNDETRAVTKIVPREDSRNNHNNEGFFRNHSRIEGWIEGLIGMHAGLWGFAFCVFRGNNSGL